MAMTRGSIWKVEAETFFIQAEGLSKTQTDRFVKKHKLHVVSTGWGTTRLVIGKRSFKDTAEARSWGKKHGFKFVR